MGPGVGETICGRIRIDGELPSGFGSPCFGPPLEATLVDTQERQWITVIEGSFLPTAVDVSRFMAGANALPSLRHPTLVRVEVVDRETEYCVIGVDALPNARPVGELLSRPVAPALLERIAVETARSLASLHRAGQIHGVLGLGSVLLWEGIPMLWQYGLAEHCDASRVAAMSQAGRRFIAAPEVAGGRGFDPRSDIYAWGALVAQLVTGKRGPEAIAAVTGGKIGRDAHPQLMALVDAALRTDPELRPFDGVALLTELQGSRGGGSSVRARVATEVPELARRYLQEFADPPTEHPGPPGVLEADADAFDIEAVLSAPKTEAPGGGLHGDDDRDRHPPVSSVAPTPLVGAYPPVDVSRMELASRTAVMPVLGGGRDGFMPGAPPQAAESPAGRGGLELDLSAARSSVSRPHMTFGGPGPAPPELPAVDPPRRSGGWAAIGVVLVGTAGAIAAMLYLAQNTSPMRRQPGTDMAGMTAPAAEAGPGPYAAAEESGASDPDDQEDGDAPVAIDRCPDDMAPLRRESGARTCIEIAEFPGLREIPRINVALREAESLCAERGRRLCGRSEWTLGCAGLGDGRAYPYGDAHVQDRCNEASAAGVPQNLSRAGARDRCVTPEGVFDLLGNVAEWVHEGVAMGGDATAVKPTCTTQRRLESTTAEGALGFRCCLTLDPTRPAHAAD